MATFRTQFDERIRFYAPSGDRIEIRHSPHIDKNGRRTLKKDKKVEIYSLIQASKEQCEIENIIRRAVEGDYNALNAVNGVYTDITNCPSSIAEAQQYIIRGKEEFDKLPKEIKAKFEYNPEIYIAEMGGDTETWLDKMGYTDAKKRMEEEQKAQEQFNLDLQKAITNLAGQGAVTNSGGEGNE